MIKVWFNHWFSTALHIINYMKDDSERELYIIGSNRNPDSVVQMACDEWYTEPCSMSDSDYLTFCLDFCREHEIDVFVPRREMNVICQNAGLFREMGVKLFLDDNADMINLFRNKAGTYEFFAKNGAEFVPMYFDVGSTDEFETAYSAITAKYARACYKFTEDEGAVSFRAIDRNLENAKALYNAPGMKVSPEAARKILSDYSFHSRLLMMPYLDGVEVSADCLHTAQGNIIIPRFKSNGRIYTIQYDEKIISYCEQILALSGLEMPCNIQFRYDGDKAYLLEINTRMSGGIQLSCLGTGVNIPNIAFNKLYGINKPWTLDKIRRKVSYIETPLIVP